MTVKQISTNSAQNLYYTNNILPNKEDATWKKIAKIAIIMLSFGSIFLITLFLDLTRKIISKLALRNAPLSPIKNLTTYEKIVKFLNKFWLGFQDGATQILKTSNFYTNKMNSYNKFGLTSGYILGTAGIIYLGEHFGFSGTTTALTLGLLGACIKPLNEYIWQPLQNKLHSV